MMPRRHSFTQLLVDYFGKDYNQHFPRGFQRIGHVAIVSIKPQAEPFSNDIAGLILENYGHIKTVCRKGRVHGDLRLPQIEKIAGASTLTTFRENFCTYTLDVAKVMFSKGNLSERVRLIEQISNGETVVDMFAGIGYFSIPIAKAKKVSLFALEKNPQSMAYLQKNIKDNKVVIHPLLADSKSPPLKLKADRIIMGYLPKTYEYLPAAFSMLKGSGTIHYHDTFKGSQLWDLPISILESAAEQSGFKLEKIISKRKVKSFAPTVYHIVIDASFTRSF